jgi:hypothetical protein
MMTIFGQLDRVCYGAYIWTLCLDIYLLRSVLSYLKGVVIADMLFFLLLFGITTYLCWAIGMPSKSISVRRALS